MNNVIILFILFIVYFTLQEIRRTYFGIALKAIYLHSLMSKKKYHDPDGVQGHG